jgi:hypothetical protein
VTYDSDRNEDGHADSFWAWALANYAIPKENARKGFYAQRRERRESIILKTQQQNVIKENPVAQERTSQRGKSLNRLMREWGRNEK